jgi:hypothetical protein
MYFTYVCRDFHCTCHAGDILWLFRDTLGVRIKLNTHTHTLTMWTVWRQCPQCACVWVCSHTSMWENKILSTLSFSDVKQIAFKFGQKAKTKSKNWRHFLILCQGFFPPNGILFPAGCHSSEGEDHLTHVGDRQSCVQTPSRSRSRSRLIYLDTSFTEKNFRPSLLSQCPEYYASDRPTGTWKVLRTLSRS